MATEKSEVIELGLTRTDSIGEVRKAILILKTDKDLRGGLKSNATAFWEGFHSRQHAHVFTEELRVDLTAQARQWYADGKDKR